MPNYLVIHSSPRGDASVSSRLANRLVARLREQEQRSDIVERNLETDPLKPLDGELVGAMFTPAGSRSAGQTGRIAVGDRLIDELRTADTVVIATGMFNFGLPVALKTWFDHILRAGSTFRYSASGPEGLLTGKRAVILAASDGVYSSGPAKAADFLVPYVRHLLGFIGITDVTVVRAEGLALGPDAARDATERALAEVDQLARGLTGAGSNLKQAA